MFKIHLGDTKSTLTEQDFHTLGHTAERYSGADIQIVVRDALMQPIRRVQNATHFMRVRGPSPSDANVLRDDLWTPCSPGAPGAVEMNWMDIAGDDLLEPPVTMADMMRSLERSKPSVNDDDLDRMTKFTNDFGQEG